MNKNTLAVTALTVAAAIGVGTVYATAPARHSHLEATGVSVSEPGQLGTVPHAVSEAFRITDSAEPARHQPIESQGVVIGTEGGTVTAYDAATGDTLWTYERDLPLCMVTQLDGAVVATYKNNAGCGDVTSIRFTEGTYKDTRSAPAPDEVSPVFSNSYVGTVSPESVELWRNDLVRTVIYGDIPNPQEPKFQPHADCTITSALTRTKLLALTETCPDGKTWLRLQNSKPEDSRKPEVSGDVELTPGSYLVAIGEDTASVLSPAGEGDASGFFLSYNEEGKSMGFSPTSATITPDSDIFTPAVGDLPHNMSWFDGSALHLFEPTRLVEEYTLDDAIGTGDAVGEKILVPVDGGIAVYDLPQTTPEFVIPVDRGDYTGPVHVRVTGKTIVEKRGETVVALTPSA